MKAKSFLIDTHILLWAAHESHRLSPSFVQAITNPGFSRFVSLVSMWEIVVKQQAGKLTVPKDFFKIIRQKGFQILPITENHIQALYKLPSIHKDPFDRLIAAQCLTENLTLITVDKNLLQYPIKTLAS